MILEPPIVHAFLDRKRDPKTKIQNTLFVFSVRIADFVNLSPKNTKKSLQEQYFSLNTVCQFKSQNIQNIMLISDLEKTFKKNIQKKKIIQRIIFQKKPQVPRKIVIWV